MANLEPINPDDFEGIEELLAALIDAHNALQNQVERLQAAHNNVCESVRELQGIPAPDTQLGMNKGGKYYQDRKGYVDETHADTQEEK